MYNTPRMASDVWSYELPAFSQPGLMNQIVPWATLEHEVTMGHSGFSNTQQPSSAFAFARENSEITNPSVFASALVRILLIVVFFCFAIFYLHEIYKWDFSQAKLLENHLFCYTEIDSLVDSSTASCVQLWRGTNCHYHLL